MNNKILLGSIIAVAILVLVSFTGVVGYQTNNSSIIARASPLFSVRSQRAINEESKDIACDYVGKGEEINIQFSSRIERAEQVQKTVDIISRMSDREFNRFVIRIILYLKNQEQLNGKETSDILQVLYHIRSNPNVLKNYDTKNNPIDITLEYITCLGSPCLIQLIVLIFAMILVGIAGWITSHTCISYPPGCPTTDCAL